jgi:hypothetical protein
MSAAVAEQAGSVVHIAGVAASGESADGGASGVIADCGALHAPSVAVAVARKYACGVLTILTYAS